jgi:hypothetical protein
MYSLAQAVQPAPDRTVQQILVAPLDRRRLPQSLEQHGCGVLAIPSNWTAAAAGQYDRLGIFDLDKDVIGARPRTPDGGDQALPAFIRAQVANRTFAMIGTSLLEASGEATADIALIEGD